jgi:hypothetical protein
LSLGFGSSLVSERGGVQAFTAQIIDRPGIARHWSAPTCRDPEDRWRRKVRSRRRAPKYNPKANLIQQDSSPRK